MEKMKKWRGYGLWVTTIVEENQNQIGKAGH